ncbi:uncharacterized protein ACA1_263610 [Acanthamoeba castellanii str. Neff]|uniref:Ubiquinol-cytochrome c chaperone domain-containing protein n=1 Tax=Acanthamoeba castellanii (strain ATCC 30010 / Neff) TaxID=1257118 RepID=L8H438_ACACF|nr:uncharacterized protein ACA1_263610 [Acanthamoeba castellanii str. Neff]ELR19211.1 hypothetical protein ACA1_263610 [Acanthamoeba castellanii str. Neff]
MRKTLYRPHLSAGALTMATPSCRALSITSRCNSSMARHPIVHRSRAGAINGCMPIRGHLFGRCSSTLRGTPEMPASSFGGRAEASATTGPSADPDLTYMSPVIFARRTPEERRRDELGVQKILEVAKERANQGESEDGLLRFLGYYGKKNQSLRSGSALYANVFYRSLDEEFYDLLGYEEKGLLPWFLISTLHMWMTSVRLRKDASSRALDTRAYFADSFWMDVEEKLNNVGVNYVGMGKAFKQMPNLYAHATLSLDKALKSTTDDQLGDALFRHIFFNRLPRQLRWAP